MSEGEDTFSPLITVVTFMGIFVVLITLVMAETPQLFYDPLTTEDLREVSVPKTFEAIDILYYADIVNGTIPKNPYSPFAYDLGGWSFWMVGDYPQWQIRHYRHYRKYLLWWIFDQMTWKTTTGKTLGENISAITIDEYFQVDVNSSKFICKDDTMQMHIFFTYNRNAYANSSQAWTNDALWFMSAIQFDQQNTGMNVWSLMAMLIFFHLPDVHWAINIVLAMPIWIVVAWLIAMLVLKIIKALPFT